MQIVKRTPAGSDEVLQARRTKNGQMDFTIAAIHDKIINHRFFKGISAPFCGKDLLEVHK